MIIEKLTNNDIRISNQIGGPPLAGFLPTDSIRLDPNNSTNLLIYPNSAGPNPFNIFIPEGGRVFNLITPTTDTTGTYTRAQLYDALLQNFFFFPLVSPPQPNFLGVFNSIPTGIVFSAGMQYFDSTYNMLMNYDASRAKWLSAESITVTLSDAGQLPTGSFLGMSRVLMVQNLSGINPLFAATVTGLTYTRQDNDAAIIEILTSGAAVNSLQIPLNSGVFKNRYTALNFDFDDILTVRNAAAGSNNITNFIVQITYKFLGLSGI